MTALQALQVLAVILAAGSLGAIVAQRLRVPDVAVFLLVGIALGPRALGFVDVPAASELNQFILVFGSAYILFDGGTTLRFAVLRGVWITVVLLATLGVVAAAAVTALAAHWYLGLAPGVALLLGAVIASTDPATLIPVFQQVKIRERVAQTVLAESAFNDAMGAILTFALLGVVQGGEAFAPGHFLVELVREAGVGLAVGAIAGYGLALLLGHERHGHLADFAPVASLFAVAGAYVLADRAGGSGFMAVFVLGMMVGNAPAFGCRPLPAALEHYQAAMAMVLRLLIFILLGTQVDFALIASLWAPGLAVVGMFILFARPATVLVGAVPDRRARWHANELLFMCWTRETGVIPAALAGLLLAQGVSGAREIAAITFLAILVTILVQAPTTRALARWLGLLEEK